MPVCKDLACAKGFGGDGLGFRVLGFEGLRVRAKGLGSYRDTRASLSQRDSAIRALGFCGCIHSRFRLWA